MYTYILTEKHALIGTITINRPEKRNMLSRDVLQEMEQALEMWKRDSEVKVIVITGSGEKAFASGADIGELNQRTMIEAFLNPNMSGTYKLIENYEKPTIAAINGVAIGGGLELALACDIRIAVNHAKLGLPETNLGIIPGGGGTQRLTRILGRGKAMDMILTGNLISGEEAEKYGLVSCSVSSEDLKITVQSYCEKMVAKGPLALQMAKMLVNKGSDIEMDTALLIEKLGQAILMGSTDKNEGTLAFLEKRNPTFIGK